MTCETCGEEVKSNCDYRQGRCPHRPALIDTIPDPLKHKYISFIKSGFRIAAGVALAVVGLDSGNNLIQGAGMLLIIAEVLGIAEELV